MALLRGFDTAHWLLFCALWLECCRAPAASLVLFLFQDGSSYPALDWHMGVGSVSSTYCRHLWDPWPSASWWHFTVGERPLIATRQQQAGKPPNYQMRKSYEDRDVQEGRDRTSFSEAISTTELSPSTSMQLLQTQPMLGAEPLTHYPMALVAVSPLDVTQPAAGTWGRHCIHCLVSRLWRNTAALVQRASLLPEVQSSAQVLGEHNAPPPPRRPKRAFFQLQEADPAASTRSPQHFASIAK